MNESTLNIQQEVLGEINCLKIEGQLDAYTSPQLESEIGDLVRKGRNKLVVDFTQLDYISSAGLGVFMAYIEEIREKGGDIKLTNMQPKIFSIFDLLGFPVFYDILADKNDAITKFEINA